jgi:hypothetical protein
MTVPNSSSQPLVITDSAAVTFLVDAELRRFLIPFLGQNATVSQVAAQLGIKQNAVLYRVEQLLNCKLLKIDHLETRAGRAVRHYRCVADSFFVPFGATSFETINALVMRTELLHHQRFAQALGVAREHQVTDEGWGTLLSRDAVGNVEVTTIHHGVNNQPSPRASMPFSRWSSIKLPPEKALEFAERLQALMAEYIGQSSNQSEAEYLLHVGFTKAP